MGIAGFLYLTLMLLPAGDVSPFEQAVAQAEAALKAGDFDQARRMIDRAVERDPKSLKVWQLWAQWAEGIGDQDDFVYALHQQLRLAKAQKASRRDLADIRARLEEVDPISPELLDLKLIFVDRLLPIAKTYQKEKRPHSAIRIHKEILTLDPERTESEDMIQKLASAPDPSLAESAKAKDLFADVSDEWIKEHDKKHNTWEDRAKLGRENYTTYTDAGYEVLVRAGEAMEQMNAFYRQFFQYGTPEDGKGVPKIELRIFKDRDEYLKMGSSPAEWSGGQFTGSAVETYVGSGGFDGMITTLFHEAAHQFVSLATTAVGWLNEGLASFFEGCRILANGTVLMNMPANHRLFPLAERMEKGWMTGPTDGINPQNPAGSNPEKAPTFSIVIENRYTWGPPWYAPTWGVVYFLYNYQDPVDGRFVYRDAFKEFINKSGGRMGEGAVENFEEVVLANPSEPTRDIDYSAAERPLRLPRTIEELDEVWKEWTLRLRDEQSGRLEVKYPYHQWAKYAVDRKDYTVAMEHFEKALVETPDDVEMLADFANFLAGKYKNTDRATKLILQAIRVLEFQEEVDEEKIKELDKLLAKWDPKRRTLDQIHQDLWAAAKNLAQRYLEAELPLMAMDVSWRFGTELGVPDILPYFEEAVRRSGKSLWLWKLAYNENNLDGWVSAGREIWSTDGPVLKSSFETFNADNFNYQFLAMDTVTSGDFSMEAEIYAEMGKITFCGLVFGKKGDQNCHAAILFPGGVDTRYTGTLARSGSVDLSSFYGPGTFKIWRHNSLSATFPDWHTLRVDVAGRMVDVWFNGKLITTHEFPNLEILRGGFGLIAGVGEARFRNVRYMARPSRDPGAIIEREVRMEKLRESSQGEGTVASVQGSWLGRVPPWLTSALWIQGQRTSWEEKGPLPTVIVLWSIQQNDAIPIHAWLSHIAEKYMDVGLEIVSIASAEDRNRLEDYLASHPFPGHVCVDVYRRKGYGHHFEEYGIQYHNLSRVLLLDIDQKVFWEGDPGFRIGSNWSPGMESYLDASLEDLIAKRRLKELIKWRERWLAMGEAVLHDGNMRVGAELLLEARSFGKTPVEEVQEAQRRLDRLITTLDALEAVTLTLSREQCEPAVETLMSWGDLLQREVDARTRKSLKSYLKCPHAIAWSRSLDHVTRIQKALKPGTESESIRALLDRIDSLQGQFPQILRKELVQALDAGETEKAVDILNSAESIPARWLARNYFNW